MLTWLLLTVACGVVLGLVMTVLVGLSSQYIFQTCFVYLQGLKHREFMTGIRRGEVFTYSGVPVIPVTLSNGLSWTLVDAGNFGFFADLPEECRKHTVKHRPMFEDFKEYSTNFHKTCTSISLFKGPKIRYETRSSNGIKYTHICKK